MKCNQKFFNTNMKKVYNKPTIKSVRLICAETLLTKSGNNENSLNIDNDITATPSMALSNEESMNDIWGNSKNSIW